MRNKYRAFESEYLTQSEADECFARVGKKLSRFWNESEIAELCLNQKVTKEVCEKI